MSGRMEDSLKIKERINKKLQNLPEEVRNYYNNLAASKEPKTCEEYIKKIAYMLNQITDDPKHYDLRNLDEPTLSKFMMDLTKKKQNGEWVETSYSHRQTTWSAVNSFCKYLVRRRILPENPMGFIDRPTNRDEIKRPVITAEDLKAMLSAVDEIETKTEFAEAMKLRDKLILLLLMNTGMRETALTQIDITDINFDERSLEIIDKLHKKKTYQLTDTLIVAIIEWLQAKRSIYSTDTHSNALITSRVNRRITPEEVAQVVKKYAYEGLGYKLTPHKLRSAYCSILYDTTKDIEFVRDAVGHTNAITTQRYIVKKESAQKQAIHMMENLMNGL